MEAVLEDAYVLICDRKIGVLKDIIPLLEQVAKSGRPILLDRRGYRGRGARHADRQSDPRRAEELRPSRRRASAIGARRCCRTSRCSPAGSSISEELGLQARGRQARRSSAAPSAWSSTRTTRRSSAAPASKAEIEGRIQQIRREIDKTTSDYDREKLRGAPRQALGRRRGDPRRRALGVRDEVAARMRSTTRSAPPRPRSPKASCRAAASRCCALHRRVARRGAAVRGRRAHRRADPARALEAPTRQIAENSAVDGGVVVARMLDGSGNVGFDAARKQYVDLVEAGIVDPAKVVRIALENAVSVASVLLLTEATMTEKPERHEDPGCRSRNRLTEQEQRTMANQSARSQGPSPRRLGYGNPRLSEENHYRIARRASRRRPRGAPSAAPRTSKAAGRGDGSCRSRPRA